MKGQRCRSCHASIHWCITPAGERLPVDAEPVAGGNIRLRTNAVPWLAETVGSTIDLFDPTDDGMRHVAHFATCPDADAWRSP